MAPTSFSCAIDTMRGVSSSFASRITSPVSGSTTSATAKAPVSSSGASSTEAMPARLSASMPVRVSLRCFLISTSPPGPSTSAAARRPTSVSLTAQAGADPVATMRSTV